MENRRNMSSGNRAPLVVGIEHHGLERLLAQPVGRKPRVTEHRAGPVPRFSKVEFYGRAEKQLEQFAEVRRYRGLCKVVALALHDAGREAWWRRCSGIFREEARVTDQDAADFWVLARGERAVAADLGPHLQQGGCPVPFSKQLPHI